MLNLHSWKHRSRLSNKRHLIDFRKHPYQLFFSSIASRKCVYIYFELKKETHFKNSY